jgi:hypothetical protein
MEPLAGGYTLLVGLIRVGHMILRMFRPNPVFDVLAFNASTTEKTAA